jgi:hypothetical protein
MLSLKGPGMEVIVCSGKATAKWSIPKALLSHHSEFFRAACNGPFKEGLENKITLQHCRPHVFEGFVHWLYFGKSPTSFESQDAIYPSFCFWVLGDRLLVPEFKNSAMRDLFSAYSSSCEYFLMTIREIKYCWKRTTAKSTLRRFILDLVSSEWEGFYGIFGKSAWMELFEKMPDFRNDLLSHLGSGCTEVTLGDYLEETSKTAHDEH